MENEREYVLHSFPTSRKWFSSDGLTSLKAIQQVFTRACDKKLLERLTGKANNVEYSSAFQSSTFLSLSPGEKDTGFEAFYMPILSS
jgi:hypothetical protein